ncbi:MAG: hypothetical protein AAB866_03085 [Patescibacteria group bacterium]
MYGIDVSIDLDDNRWGNWVMIGRPVIATSKDFKIIDVPINQAFQFYRLWEIRQPSSDPPFK